MDRQTLRDWVIRFNEKGPDGLINIPSPGVPPKLDNRHKAFLARIVDEGPIPAVHGVVRWRACDLIMRLHEEFRLSVSDDTVYRALKELGLSHVSARPRAYKQDADAMDAFKKTLPYAWRKSARTSRRAHRQKSGFRTRCASARRTSNLSSGMVMPPFVASRMTAHRPPRQPRNVRFGGRTYFRGEIRDKRLWKRVFAN